MLSYLIRKIQHCKMQLEITLIGKMFYSQAQLENNKIALNKFSESKK